MGLGTGIAISVKSAAVNGVNGSTGSVTVNNPTGLANNDYMLAIQCMIENGEVTAGVLNQPGGWTAVASGLRFTSTGVPSINGAVWSKVASSEPASWTWTSTGDGIGTIQGTAAAVLAINGQKTSSTVNVNATGTNFGGGTTSTCPSITPTVANALLVCFVLSNGADSFTPASGMTEQVDFNVSATPIAITVNTLVLSGPAAATGTKSITHTVNDNNMAYSMAIAPATGLQPAVLLNQTVNRAAYF